MEIDISSERIKGIFDIEQYCKDKNINTKKVKELYCQDNHIIELKGLEKLVNLEWLNCSYNEIKALNGLDKLVNLEVLYCDNNKIANLNLSKLINLKYLYCDNNKMIKLRGLFDELVNLKKLKK